MVEERRNKEITNKQELEKKNACNIGNCKDIETKTSNIDYDHILSSAGELGRYQIFLFFSTFPFYFFGVFVYYSQLFMTEVSPNHWCWIPELENLTEIERRTIAIPSDDSHLGYSKCQSYVANWTEVLMTGSKPNNTWKTQPCQNGWEFNKTEIPYPTISSEMGWVCEKDSYQATAQAIFFLGSIVGGFLIGWIADRYGRLPATVISSLIGCVGGVASTFTRDFIEFSICRFFMGMSYDSCMIMIYLLVLEYVAPKYRTYSANLSFALFYSVGVTALPWIALACGHWKTFSLVTSLPLALALAALFYVPESPRWLLSKGRIEETIKKLLVIGRVNKKEIPPKLIEQFRTANSNIQEENASCLELLRRPLLRRMICFMCVQFMCCCIVFDGLVRTIGQLKFDFFVSFSVVSFTECPSMILCMFILDRIGRRWLTVIVSLTACIFSIITPFVGSGLVSVMCAVIARFMVNMAYGAATQWAAEMLPTPVRGSGMSVIHICSYIATVMSPYIAYLDTYLHWLPLVVVGCLSGLGAVFAFFLPETCGKDMPQTFEDSEELVKNQKLWDFPLLSKNKQEDEGHVNDCFEL